MHLVLLYPTIWINSIIKYHGSIIKGTTNSTQEGYLKT